MCKYNVVTLFLVFQNVCLPIQPASNAYAWNCELGLLDQVDKIITEL